MCDFPKAYQERKRKANKRHKCYECGKVIEKGELYIHVSGVWDEPMAFRFHKTCHDVYNYVRDFDESDEVCFGDAFDTLFYEGAFDALGGVIKHSNFDVIMLAFSLCLNDSINEEQEFVIRYPELIKDAEVGG